jgi:hypothetical protein
MMLVVQRLEFSREQALDIVKEKAKTFTYTLGDETFGNLQVVSAPFCGVNYAAQSTRLFTLSKLGNLSFT